MKTGKIASMLGISAYIVPFIFVYHPVLLMKGSLFDVLYQFVMAFLGVAAVSMGVIGASYFGNIRWSIPSRLLFFASFLGFIIPSKILDLWAALAVIVGILATPQVWRMIMGAVSRSSRPSATLEP
jgi:TRAP-type uncharacterized transport system fused permease subunit